MNNIIKSLTILLHAIVFTAILTNLNMSDSKSNASLKQKPGNYFYPVDSLATSHF